ncbi:unnamed protein product [Alopecurus aequalis]
MQILRLLDARRAPMATSAKHRDACEDGDEGLFFDLDFSSCSVRASSYSSGSLSGSDSDDEDELDFIISLQQRSRSASQFFTDAPLKFCTSEPPARANSLQSQRSGDRKRGITLRSLSFGARKAAQLYERPSFARSSSSSRLSFARRSTSSTQSLRVFMDQPPRATEQDVDAAAGRTWRPAASRDVIRRCLAKISRRISTAVSPRAGGIRRLRKCRSASSAAPVSCYDDDSVVEKQDSIAGAIAHCKESRSTDSPRRW